MKRLLKILGLTTLLLVSVACAQIIQNSGQGPLPKPPEGTLRLATYNAHYIWLDQETGAWSTGDWERRKIPMDSAFKALQADVIAFQEMESFSRSAQSQTNLTLDWLRARNPAYAAAAVGDPATFPSTQPIFYKRDRLDLRDQGWFFFSDTPEVIYSRTFNGSFPAFASWADFRDRTTNTIFRVVNVHYEYKSRSNRQLSAALTRDRIAPVIDAGTPVFLLGDLNARLGAKTHDILAQAGLTFSPVTGATYHFNRGLNLFGAIDHIAYSNGLTPLSEPVVLRRKFNGEWPTDHYPVIADFTLHN